jgi:hypothetical protein
MTPTNYTRAAGACFVLAAVLGFTVSSVASWPAAAVGLGLAIRGWVVSRGGPTVRSSAPSRPFPGFARDVSRAAPSQRRQPSIEVETTQDRELSGAAKIANEIVVVGLALVLLVSIVVVHVFGV